MAKIAVITGDAVLKLQPAVIDTDSSDAVVGVGQEVSIRLEDFLALLEVSGTDVIFKTGVS